MWLGCCGKVAAVINALQQIVAYKGAQVEKCQGMKKQTCGFHRSSSRLEVKQKLSRRFSSPLEGVEIALLPQCAHRVSYNGRLTECSLPDSLGCALIIVCNQGNSKPGSGAAPPRLACGTCCVSSASMWDLLCLPRLACGTCYVLPASIQGLLWPGRDLCLYQLTLRTA